LLEEQRIIAYSSWQASHQLPVNQDVLAEADRCAELVSEFV